MLLNLAKVACWDLSLSSQITLSRKSNQVEVGNEGTATLHQPATNEKTLRKSRHSGKVPADQAEEAEVLLP